MVANVSERAFDLVTKGVDVRGMVASSDGLMKDASVSTPWAGVREKVSLLTMRARSA